MALLYLLFQSDRDMTFDLSLCQSNTTEQLWFDSDQIRSFVSICIYLLLSPLSQYSDWSISLATLLGTRFICHVTPGSSQWSKSLLDQDKSMIALSPWTKGLLSSRNPHLSLQSEHGDWTRTSGSLSAAWGSAEGVLSPSLHMAQNWDWPSVEPCQPKDVSTTWGDVQRGQDGLISWRWDYSQLCPPLRWFQGCPHCSVKGADLCPDVNEYVPFIYSVSLMFDSVHSSPI